MQVRRADPAEAELVSTLLSAAAQDLVRRGEPLWTASDTGLDAVRPHVAAGRYFIARNADLTPAGVFRLDPEDPLFWPDAAPGFSAYVHKVAVHPDAQGRGIAQLLLAHACEIARAQGRQYLRLDCVAGRPKLRAVYERFGFRHHSQWRMGGGLFERFELAL